MCCFREQKLKSNSLPTAFNRKTRKNICQSQLDCFKFFVFYCHYMCVFCVNMSYLCRQIQIKIYRFIKLWFIKFDINEFYPPITDKLLDKT